MNKALNRFAILVACATFCLIIAGALVTSHDAGLATSDWPLSNGQFFPKMVGNLFWEHGHRMIATTVGLLTIGLLIYIRAKEKRQWVRRRDLLLSVRSAFICARCVVQELAKDVKPPTAAPPRAARAVMYPASMINR